MSQTVPPPNDATAAQIRAADPGVSTWLSANAGSGKTRVLTDRVARMLLRGVPPQSILCLTYTKAAASEMQNRLFERLGEWAMMPSPELQKNLMELGVEPYEIKPDALNAARSLFAKAIETPGGLKIQTIHSFCSSLLRRFPLEAGVSPAFSEMDDRTGKRLRADILEEVAEAAPDAMSAFATEFTGDDTNGFLQDLTKRAADFVIPLDVDALRTELDLTTQTDEASIVASVFLGGEADLMARIVAVLSTVGKDSDIKLADRMRNIDWQTPTLATLAAIETFLLTSATSKSPFSTNTRAPTKDTKTAIGTDLNLFNQFRERLAEARDTRLALAALKKTEALHKFAAEFLPRLAHHKALRGWLDFDDLILRARDLLTDPRVASWVLFRLDGGIDHVLVDEAQDTSPAQWDVIKLLTSEFFSGEGARANTHRTVFVVGDQKQSIYSFQGADPAQFDANRAYFDAEISRVEKDLQRQDLRYSFRSAPAILGLVDASFPGDLSKGMGNVLEHVAFKSMLPGRVDLWPWIDGQASEETAWDKDWFDPVDTVGNDHHSVQLADRIADFIDDRIRHGQITRVEKSGSVTRRIDAGDFLILVQRRSPLFHEIIRACKARNLPMAGADRLRVGGELGVKDLTAFLKFLATPEDDLSLASVLRSPLFGLSEAQLYDLAHDRGKLHLRGVIEARKNQYADVFSVLEDMQDRVDYLRPYEMLERVLTVHGGREKFAARLGPEAEEGINELLNLALNYESADTPSLTGFLAWLEADEVEIKRQMDGNAGKIRVMTVHGAKGLEAPIVILPDTGISRNLIRDDIIDAAGTAMWKAKTDQMPAAQTASADALKQRQAEERMRLLYVALTRAENWLITCGAGLRPKDDSAAWYPIIEAGLRQQGAIEKGDVLRLENGVFPDDTAAAAAKDPQVTTDHPTLPDWIKTPISAPPVEPQILQPSDLGGDKALFGSGRGLDKDAAIARGTAIHSLLEHLPGISPEQWENASASILGDTTIEGSPDPLSVAKAVIAAPELQHIFAPGTLAEVNVAGHISALDIGIRGTIDRLVISDDHVLAVDFKTNALVPDHPENTPESILRQMGAYLVALEQIYPDHRIELAILWSEIATLMPLPHDIVRVALSRAHIS